VFEGIIFYFLAVTPKKYTIENRAFTKGLAFSRLLEDLLQEIKMAVFQYPGF
jgi:hypothetical protein